MTMFTSKPKFNLAEFLAEPAPSKSSRGRSRSGARTWESKPATEAAEEETISASEVSDRPIKSTTSGDI